MLFKSDIDITEALIDGDIVQARGDELIFNHFYDAAPAMEHAYNCREFGDNGWTHDREQRQIASIPLGKWMELTKNRPDLVKDPSALKKWIQTDEAAPYRTVKALNTGRSGKCIVK